jgi:hypothetical protein
VRKPGAEEVRYTHRRIRTRSLKTIFGSVTVARMSYSRAGGDSVCPLDAVLQLQEYLAQGWPIASGPVEGACKNLIKDRMERSGMRWTEAMAEAVVQLRAIYLSGDFDRYWSFHIEQDQRRLHPPGRWSVVPK